jgi:hypothetical protein
MPTTLPDKPPRQTRKSKYVIQEPQMEATNDKPIENQWIDYSSTFDSTADAMNRQTWPCFHQRERRINRYQDRPG